MAVHDAVRPFIDLETIDRVFDEAARQARRSSACRPSIREAGQPRRQHVRIRATLPRESW